MNRRLPAVRGVEFKHGVAVEPEPAKKSRTTPSRSSCVTDVDSMSQTRVFGLSKTLPSEQVLSTASLVCLVDRRRQLRLSMACVLHFARGRLLTMARLSRSGPKQIDHLDLLVPSTLARTPPVRMLGRLAGHRMADLVARSGRRSVPQITGL